MRIGIDIDNKEHYKRSSVYVIIEIERDESKTSTTEIVNKIKNYK